MDKMCKRYLEVICILYKKMESIKKIKEFYKISRETLHIISGISTDALKRYENGEETPRKYYLLLTSMLSIETFEMLFHLSRSQLKKSDVDRIEKKIKEEMTCRERECREYRHKIMHIK